MFAGTYCPPHHCSGDTSIALIMGNCAFARNKSALVGSDIHTLALRSSLPI